MQKILQKKSKSRVEFFSIQEWPTAGTWGDLMLLVHTYKQLDSDYADPVEKRFRQLNFNTNFLKYIEAKYGELHCEYCGKKNLVIYPWDEKKKNKSNMATADHFNPRSKFPQFEFNNGNLRVCCYKCNEKKKDNVVSVSMLKFEYPEENRIY